MLAEATEKLEDMLNDFQELSPEEKEYLADYVIEWATSRAVYNEFQNRDYERRCG